MDHCGDTSFLRPDISTLCASMTALIAKAIQDSSAPRLEREICCGVMKVPGRDGIIGSDSPKSPFVR